MTGLLMARSAINGHERTGFIARVKFRKGFFCFFSCADSSFFNVSGSLWDPFKKRRELFGQVTDNMANVHSISESIGHNHHRLFRTLNISFRNVLPQSVAPFPVAVNDHYDNVTSHPDEVSPWRVGVNGHSVDVKCLFGLVTVLPDSVTLWPANARLLPVCVGLFPLTVK